MADNIVNITIPDLDKTIAALSMLDGQAKPALARALFRHAEKVATRSKDTFVPVDKGTLRSTIHTELPKTEGEMISVGIAAGGPAAPYARLVHENLNPRIRWRKPGSGPKYLEKPFLEEAVHMDESLSSVLVEVVRDLFR